MSWEEFISHVVLTSTQVNKMAVYDLKGRPMAVTKELETCESEGMSLIKCVLDPNKSVTKIYMDQDSFVCIQGIDKTLIGRSEKRPEIILAAYNVPGHVIAAIGTSVGDGSFILELKHGLRLMAQGKLIDQQQFDQQMKEKQQQLQKQKQEKQRQLQQQHCSVNDVSADEETMADLVHLFCDSINRARLVSVFPQKKSI